MQVWEISHPGAIRAQNQDTCASRVLADGRIIAVVCDGMGGARAGNVASTMGVELFMTCFLEEQGDDRERMQTAAALANREIYDRAGQDPDCNGMGTTLVAALAGEREAVILNEGDSRAYYISQAGIMQITRDHSLVEDMVRRGELTREEARTHPHRNLITRALGSDPMLQVDCFRQPLSQGDFILLCTDGLTNMMSEQEILFEVIHGGDVSTCCQRLLEIALRRKAPDNVTAVLIGR